MAYFFSLYLHQNQRYLNLCVVFYKHIIANMYDVFGDIIHDDDTKYIKIKLIQ